MNEIAELLKSLGQKITAHIATGATEADKARLRTEVLDAIRTGHHDVLWQPIANVGFAAGRTSRDEEVNGLKSRAETAETTLTTVKGERDVLANKHTDLAAVQTEAARRIEAAENKAKEAEKLAAARVEKAVKDRDVTAYEAKLVSKGVDPDVAKAHGILFRDKAKYDKDGNLTVMQPGTENIPYTVHGDELLTVLADETTKKLPPSQFISKVDAGAGSRGDTTEKGGGGTGDLYSQIRAEEAERAKAKAPRDIAGAYTGNNRFAGGQAQR